MPIEIHVDQALFDDAMRRMQKIPYALEKAIYPTISVVVSNAHEEIRNALNSEVALPKKIINKAITMLAPQQENGGVTCSINVESSGIALIHYDVLPNDVTARAGVASKNWTGFSYALRRGDRRESKDLTRSVSLPFIARMKSGHLGVYHRTGRIKKNSKTGKNYQEIKELYGPSVQYHFTPKLEHQIIESAERELPRVLARFVDQVIADHKLSGVTV